MILNPELVVHKNSGISSCTFYSLCKSSYTCCQRIMACAFFNLQNIMQEPLIVSFLSRTHMINVDFSFSPWIRSYMFIEIAPKDKHHHYGSGTGWVGWMSRNGKVGLNKRRRNGKQGNIRKIFAWKDPVYSYTLYNYILYNG